MIRPMTVSDAPAVRSLQTYLRYADPDLIEAAVRGPFDGRVAIEGSPVGYAIFFPGHPATLSELVVAPSHRRQGYGRALVENVAATVDSETLEVTTPIGATAAKRFYTTLGFEPGDRIGTFYEDGTDALRLRRRE